MKAEPGAINVIPGRAEFPVELRDLDTAKIDHIWERIQARFKQIDKEESVETHCELLEENAPARSDTAIQNAIRDAAESLGLATMDLPRAAVQIRSRLPKLRPWA
jgi:acetylornithine deacetylase/succinyl-diaminopimelate desuccinylase-like protein